LAPYGAKIASTHPVRIVKDTMHCSLSAATPDFGRDTSHRRDRYYLLAQKTLKTERALGRSTSDGREFLAGIRHAKNSIGVETAKIFRLIAVLLHASHFDFLGHAADVAAEPFSGKLSDRPTGAN
jgi:hypothetical protein